MSVTEALLAPHLANPGAPLVTHYDDATGSRVELSVATLVNWAAKTANWLRDEHDVEPGDPVAVLMPAHWQTAGVLLGAWWCGAAVTARSEGAAVAVVAPGVEAPGAGVVATASLHPMGLGGGYPVDYLDDVRLFGDHFSPYGKVPGDTPALGTSTVDELVAEAAHRAGVLGVTSSSRVLSTVDWDFPDGLLTGFLAVLAGGGSLVHVSNPDPARLAARRASEHTTLDLVG
ncbi:TIGR03089 family protein [Actinosynnema sp. NPDC020468]|uniref:TIGR03089 family protein n=1 Tax=Actinosynnema sp. NPDC020468 TaxID=3154488 RepID=UPI0033F95401